MLRYTGFAAHDVFWRIEEGKIHVLPESTSPEVLLSFHDKCRDAKHQIFMDELFALSAMLEVGYGSFFWIGEDRGTFWRLELMRPLENRLSLHLSPLRRSKELCDILTRGAVTPSILQGAQRVERLLIHLDHHGNYQIDSIGERLAKNLGIREGENISGLVQHLVYNKSAALLDISLRTDQTLQTTDIAIYKGQRYYLAITLVPFNHRNRHVSLSLFVIEPEDFYRIQLHGSSVGRPQQEEEKLGFAFFRRGFQDARIPEISNEAFQRLLPAERWAEFFATLNARLSDEPGSEARFWYRPCLLENYECFASRTREGLFLNLWREPLQKKDQIKDKLTQREQEIAHHLCGGSPLRYIASICGISEGTVKKTASNVYRKMGVSGRVELLQLLYG